MAWAVRVRTGGPWLARLQDAAPAVAMLAIGVVSAPRIDSVSTADRMMDLLGVGLIVLAAAALALRRRHPVAVLATSAGAASAYLALGYPYGSVMISTAVAVYAVTRRLPLRRAIGWCAAALGAMLVHLATSSAALPGLLGVAPVSAWVVVPATAGAARRLVLEARAREQRERDHRLIDGERLRLTHDVHDIVEHGLTAIRMQADIALHLRQTRPDQAYDALAAISRASADALTELRLALTVLTPQTSPARCGISLLPELVERVSKAGVPVHVMVTGMRRDLPADVDLVAYRILQESLTNVVKHAPGARTEVMLHYDADTLRLQVSNDRPSTDALAQRDAARQPVEGFGIPGMRRRVQELGGVLAAGPNAESGGFTVQAHLPLSQQPSPSERTQR